MSKLTQTTLLMISLALGINGVAEAGKSERRYRDSDDNLRTEQRLNHRTPSHFAKKVERRQHNQDIRIREGRKDGRLTRKEFKRLRKEQKKIALLEQCFSKDGHLSKRERRILDNAQDEASRHIRRAKHNERYRKESLQAHQHHQRHDHHSRPHWYNDNHYSHKPRKESGLFAPIGGLFALYFID